MGTHAQSMAVWEGYRVLVVNVDGERYIFHFKDTEKDWEAVLERCALYAVRDDLNFTAEAAILAIEEMPHRG